ncbi:hypothetical protein FTX61_01950 [Nitriliruptoraceae bacterium ZYF776]|nr:hypothetical protein [Profundirhabdus halotolerans]
MRRDPRTCDAARGTVPPEEADVDVVGRLQRLDERSVGRFAVRPVGDPRAEAAWRALRDDERAWARRAAQRGVVAQHADHAVVVAALQGRLATQVRGVCLALAVLALAFVGPAAVLVDADPTWTLVRTVIGVAIACGATAEAVVRPRRLRAARTANLEVVARRELLAPTAARVRQPSFRR